MRLVTKRSILGLFGKIGVLNNDMKLIHTPTKIETPISGGSVTDPIENDPTQTWPESDEQRFLRDFKSTAIHEAGHAVVAHNLGGRCQITLERNDRATWDDEKAVLGRIWLYGLSDHHSAAVGVAGIVAEKIAEGFGCVGGEVLDLFETGEISPSDRECVGDLRDKQLFQKIVDVRWLLEERTEQHEAVVDALLELNRKYPHEDCWVLTGHQVGELLGGGEG